MKDLQATPTVLIDRFFIVKWSGGVSIQNINGIGLSEIDTDFILCWLALSSKSCLCNLSSSVRIFRSSSRESSNASKQLCRSSPLRFRLQKQTDLIALERYVRNLAPPTSLLEELPDLNGLMVSRGSGGGGGTWSSSSSDKISTGCHADAAAEEVAAQSDIISLAQGLMSTILLHILCIFCDISIVQVKNKKHAQKTFCILQDLNYKREKCCPNVCQAISGKRFE